MLISSFTSSLIRDLWLFPASLLKTLVPDPLFHSARHPVVLSRTLPRCGGESVGKSTSPGCTPCCLGPHDQECLDKYLWQSFAPVSHKSCVGGQSWGQKVQSQKKKGKQNKCKHKTRTLCFKNKIRKSNDE